MHNGKNLKSWKPGQSGGPAGKPKGSKHVSTWIREMLEDEKFTAQLSNGKNFRGVPAKALAKTLVIKALEGDLKAFDLLVKHGYGTLPKENVILMDFGVGAEKFINKT